MPFYLKKYEIFIKTLSSMLINRDFYLNQLISSGAVVEW